MATATIYLEYVEELGCYAVSKNKIAALQEKGDVADIRLPKQDGNKNNKRPTIGFLLGQDTTKDGTEYYSVGNNYLQSMLAAGADIKFLDYDNPYKQMKECAGAVLPGGAFDNPESFFIDGKDMGAHEGKRFFAYKAVIREAYQHKKPMLGICAGAQMIGAILGNMKMYRSLEKEVPIKTVHKPRAETDVRVHGLKLLPNTPLFKIMGLTPEENRITINSRHAQSMIHPALQEYVAGTPKVKMDMYAVSDADGVPEIWGNEKAGILCVQGHPEDLAQKDEKMLRIYQHIVKLSAQYHHNRQNSPKPQKTLSSGRE